MKKFLLLLIGLVFPSTSMAITQVVSADQTLSNGDVMSIVTQQVYGTTKNFTVSGNQQIMSGGTSYNSNIYPYGQQNVEAGGISYNTNVQYRAVQNVNGTAYSSTVATSGTIDVNAGGYAEDTTVNGGIFIVSAGATVAKTYLNGGRENISGTDESSFVSGGLQEILSGGISKQAVVTGGTQQVDVGGSSIGATFSNNGRQKVYGTTEQTTVNSGAIIDIIDNGTAQQTTLNGGSMNVDYGATSYQTTVNSGTQSIYGTETGSSVNGGRQQVENGGFVSGAVVKTGGVQSIFSGGRAENTTLENGGWMFLFSGGTLSGTITANNSVVNIVGSNSIPDMEIQNSAINIPRDYAFSTVQFGNLSGSGIFSINSDLSEGTSDKILIDSGSGNFGLIVHDYSADGSTPLKYEIIDENAGASDRFYLVGNAVDVGAYRYNLEQEGSNWFLVRTQDVTDSALLAKNTYSSLASLFYTHLTPVYNRIRLYRSSDKPDNHLWIKGLGQELKFDYKDGSSSQIKLYGSEVGYDQEVWKNSFASLSLGLYGGYTSSQQKYDRSGHGDADTRALGFYGVFKTRNHYFVDIVGTYFQHNQKLKTYMPAGSEVVGKYDVDSWQISSSLGKRFYLAKDWFLEPSVGFNYMYLGSVHYRTNYNTLVEADDANYFTTRADIVTGKTFTTLKNNRLDAYGRFALIHDVDGTSDVCVADYCFKEDLSSLRYEVGAGIQSYWKDNLFAYTEASTQFGSRIQLPFEISFGVQYHF